MICPHCGEITPDDSRFCCHCASDILTAEEPIAEQVASLPVRKKGRLWPPLLTLGILFAIGLTLFFLIDIQPAADTNMPWFSVQNGTLYFDEDRYTGAEELTVPSALGGQQITAISDGCFSGCSELTAVHLPEGITRIGDRAFAGCISLRGIKLPETVVTIGTEAFSGCSKLEAMCIPYSVTQIGSRIFGDCDKLSYIFYPGPAKDFMALNLDHLPAGAGVYCVDGVLSGE